MLLERVLQRPIELEPPADEGEWLLCVSEVAGDD